MTMMLAVGVAESAVQRVVVIGAGSMGGGIAAQFANAGVPVDLLDIAGPADNRDAPARAGLERQLKAGGFMHPDAAALVRIGNVEDDLARVAAADWVVEAILEKLELKQALYARLEPLLRPGCIVSSNTSTIPRSDLVAGRGPDFVRSFFITHFFNPPRVMRLFELVSASDSDPVLLARVTATAETVLGKTVVPCRDTPGFIANRIGCHWLAVAVIEAVRRGLTAEQADLAMTALGVPKTGVFGLLDLIGLDLVPPIWGSLMQTLSQSDDLHTYDLPGHKLIRSMLAAGRFGRKSQAGFYRLAADRSRETLDFSTNEYRGEARPSADALPRRDPVALLDSDSPLGHYARAVMLRVWHYVADVGPDIAGDVAAIDTAMELGYAWAEGPFRLADRYGLVRLADRLTAEGLAVPDLLRQAVAAGGFYAAGGAALGTDGGRGSAAPGGGFRTVAAARRQKLAGNEAASLWDLGDGVACFALQSKLGIFSPAVFDILEETLSRGGDDFSALVLANDDKRAFSAGADLGFVLDLVAKERFDAIDAYIARGQRAFLALKYADFPVVAAGHGLALGGGCEFMLHADRVVAHAEFCPGLPEVKVGLIPGWGGCAQMLLRAQAAGADPAAATARAFATILAGRQSTSALDALNQDLLRATDRIVMNRDHVLAVAVAEARAMAVGYEPPVPARIDVLGAAAAPGLLEGVRAAHAAGTATDTDLAIAGKLAETLTGGPDGDATRPVSEAEIMVLERAALVALTQTAQTQARIRHMLKTGKPLRN